MVSFYIVSGGRGGLRSDLVTILNHQLDMFSVVLLPLDSRNVIRKRRIYETNNESCEPNLHRRNLRCILMNAVRFLLFLNSRGKYQSNDWMDFTDFGIWRLWILHLMALNEGASSIPIWRCDVLSALDTAIPQKHRECIHYFPAILVCVVASVSFVVRLSCFWLISLCLIRSNSVSIKLTFRISRAVQLSFGDGNGVFAMSFWEWYRKNGRILWSSSNIIGIFG